MSERDAALATAARARMATRPRDAFTLVLDGLEVPVLSGRVSRSIDTVADGWSAEIAWEPGRDRRLDERVAPYSYCPAQVYLGPNLVNTGRLYTVTNTMTPTGTRKDLEGWSLTADLVDSHIPPEVAEHVGGTWRYQWTGLSVWNIANAICGALGIGVRTDLGDVSVRAAGFDVRVVEPFEEVKASLTETYAALLTRLASQRGMLVSNDVEGNLFLTAARTKGAPVASLTESQPVGREWKAKFDGRKRFYRHTVYGQSGMGDDIQAQAIDDKVPKSRITNSEAPDVKKGDVTIAAAWKRSKQLAEALTLPFPVAGWYAPGGALWTPNTRVAIKAPHVHIEREFVLLIRSVEYVHETQGQTATLQIMPSEVYTGEELKEPWE